MKSLFNSLFLSASLILFSSFITCSENKPDLEIFPNEILLHIISNFDTFEVFFNLACTSNSMYKFICSNFEDPMLCLHPNLDIKIKKAKNIESINTIEENKDQPIFADGKNNHPYFRMQLNILYKLFYDNYPNTYYDPNNITNKLPRFYMNIFYLLHNNKLPHMNLQPELNIKNPHIDILKKFKDSRINNLYYLGLDQDEIKTNKIIDLKYFFPNSLKTTINNASYIKKYFFRSFAELEAYVELFNKTQPKNTVFSKLDDHLSSLISFKIEGYIPHLENKILFDSHTLAIIALKSIECYSENQVMTIMRLLLDYPCFDVNNNVSPSQSLINSAYQKRYSDIVQLLIEHGASPYKNLFERKDLLSIIFENNDIETFKLFLNYGLNPDKLDKDLSIPLLFYTKNFENQSFYELILEKIFDNLKINSKAAANSLFYACNKGDIDIIQILLENGADINSKSYLCDLTPLANAIISKHYEIVEFLVKNGADLYAIDQYDRSILNIAMMINDENITEFLFNNMKWEELDLKDLIVPAATNGYIFILKKILSLDLNIEEKLNLLTIAALNGKIEAVEFIDSAILEDINYNEILEKLRNHSEEIIKKIEIRKYLIPPHLDEVTILNDNIKKIIDFLSLKKQ